jgi:hypothetical protein
MHAERATMRVVDSQSVERGGAPMTTIQAVWFGVMLALTPSLVLLAFLLWQEGIGLREVGADLEVDDQPPHPNTR